MFTGKNTRRLEIYCYITFFNPSSKKWKEEVTLNLESKEQPDFILPRLPRKQRFLFSMAFSVYKVVRKAMQEINRPCSQGILAFDAIVRVKYFCTVNAKFPIDGCWNNFLFLV